MLVKEVLLKYHKIVPFPWTPAKLKKAGRKIPEFLCQVGIELARCSDAETASAKKTIEAIEEIKTHKDAPG